MNNRLQKLQQQISPHSAWLLTDAVDIHYFTGFATLVPEERESFLLLTRTAAYLLHATFSPAPAQDGVTLMSGTSLSFLRKNVSDALTKHELTELKVDKTRLFADEYDVLHELKIPLDHLDKKHIWELRSIKESAEIELIRRASTIARQTYDQLRSQIKVGQTEKDIQKLLESEMLKLGSEKPAFPTIVCFGEHGALPHHQPTSTKLTANTPILLDFGATVEGYRSDMTRSFWFGQKPSDDFKRIEHIVQTAYQAALAKAKTITTLGTTDSPLTAADIDSVARNLITEQGFGEEFIHTTGHGLGLDIHEQPSLYWANKAVLKLGMVITIEPGIYLEGQFGYRYENTVLLAASGVEELTL